MRSWIRSAVTLTLLSCLILGGSFSAGCASVESIAKSAASSAAASAIETLKPAVIDAAKTAGEKVADSAASALQAKAAAASAAGNNGSAELYTVLASLVGVLGTGAVAAHGQSKVASVAAQQPQQAPKA